MGRREGAFLFFFLAGLIYYLIDRGWCMAIMTFSIPPRQFFHVISFVLKAFKGRYRVQSKGLTMKKSENKETGGCAYA